MPLRRTADQVGRGPAQLVNLVRAISYEVMPFKRTETEVPEYVPASIPRTVTATEGAPVPGDKRDA